MTYMGKCLQICSLLCYAVFEPLNRKIEGVWRCSVGQVTFKRYKKMHPTLQKNVSTLLSKPSYPNGFPFPSPIYLIFHFKELVSISMKSLNMTTEL